MGRVNAAFAMTALPGPGAVDRDFALVHVPATVCPAVKALWSLDLRLGEVVASTTQPMVGQLRLTWWHEALTSLRMESVKGEPMLDALAQHVRPLVSGEELARLVEGWDALLDALPLPDSVLAEYAELRGQMFALTARLLTRATDEAAGQGWALADFAARCSDQDTRVRAYRKAREAFSSATIEGLPRALRILARLARDDALTGRALERTRWQLWRALR